MSSTARGVLGLVVLSVLAAACRPKPTDGGERPAPSASVTLTVAAADAGAARDAAPVSDRPDRPFAAVAQSAESVRLLPLANGKLLLAAGPILYEAKADGTLALVSSLDAFAAVVPDDESLVGYVEGVSSPPAFVASDAEGIVAQWPKGTYRVTPDKLVATNGAKLRSAVTWKDRVLGTGNEGELTWLTGSGPLPSWSGGTASFAIDASGGLAMVGTMRRDTSVHVALPGAPATTATIPGGKDGSCTMLTAYDRGVYVRCRSWEDRAEKIRFFRFEGGAWRPVFTDASGDGPAAVAADGALWVGKGREIVRCEAGACKAAQQETFALTADVPSYVVSSEDVLVNNDAFRSYSNFHISRSKRSQGERVEQIFPRAPGDVWAIVRSGESHLVVHTGTAATSVSVLPSRGDARVLVRNVKPPTPWVGHCEQIFVRIGPGSDAEALGKRGPEVQKLVDGARTDTDYGMGWALVRGRLHDKDSTGVILWRQDVETSLGYVERVATKMIDAFAKNPVDRPTAYCTLPVLDAIYAPAPL